MKLKNSKLDTYKCEGKMSAEHRAQLLARVYRHLLARAAEIEAAEQQMQAVTSEAAADEVAQPA